MQAKSFLFDLDGTITDSAQGIVNSVVYALERFDIRDVPDETLSLFLGPPLWDSFPRHFNFSAADTEKAVGYYREYFHEKGMFENAVYEGIPELLLDLKKNGNNIFIATAKPEHYAGLIIDHFELSHLFNDVCGASMDSSRSDKTSIIGYVLSKHAIQPNGTWMIGDSHHDILGGKHHDLKTIAVGYGYGSHDILNQSEPHHFCHSVTDLHTCIKHQILV